MARATQHLRSTALFVGWLLLAWWAVRRSGGVHTLADFAVFAEHLDAGWYRGLAEHGYRITPGAAEQNVVFFPLFPWLARSLAAVTPMSPMLALHVVQKLGLVAAALLVWRWARSALSEQVSGSALVADLCMLGLLLHPAWIFMMVPYPESLFVALTFALLIAWQRQSLPGLVVVACLLCLTRPQGLFVLPAAALTWCVDLPIRDRTAAVWRRSGWLRRSLPHVAVVLGSGCAIAILCGVMHRVTGDPLAFLHYRSAWPDAPGLANLVDYLKLDLGMHLGRLVTVWLVVAGCVLLWRRGLRFACLLCAIAVLAPAYQGKLGDMVRYSLAAAPAWIVLWAAAASRPRLLVALTGFSVLLGALTLGQWAARAWVG